MDERMGPLEGLWVFLAAVPEGGFLPLDLAVLDIGVMAGYVEVVGCVEAKLVSVPGTDVKVLVAVLVGLLSDADLEELIGGVGAAALSQDVAYHLLL